MRGGFSPSWLPKMPTSADSAAFVRHLGKRVAFDAGTSVLEHGLQHMDNWNPISTMFHEFRKEHETNKGRNKDGGGRTTVKINPGSQSDPGVTKQAEYPIVTKTLPTKMEGAEGAKQTETLRTNVYLGEPTARAIIRAGKQNGTTRMETFNTSREYRDQDERLAGDLFFRGPFNGSLWVLPFEFGQPNLGDLAEALSGDTAANVFGNSHTNRTNISRTYASIIKSETLFKFNNCNRILDLKATVHIVRSLEGLTTTRDLRGVFNTSNSSQTVGAIPYVRQLTSRSNSTSGDTSYVSTENRIGLTDSPYFRDNFELVKSTSRTIPAGSTWQFKSNVHYGSGAHLEDAIELYKSGVADGVAPAHIANEFMYVFEFVGQPNTALLKNEYDEQQEFIGTTRYVGTGPTNVTMEMAKYMTFANKSAEYDLNTNSFPGGQVPVYCNLRQYINSIKPSENIRKVFFVEQDDIDSGEHYIPIETQVQESFAGLKEDENIVSKNQKM